MTTDTRQLRLLVDGVLAAYGIDNLELSIKLVAGIRDFLQSPTPVRTREELLASIEKGMVRGATKHLELQAIAEEIERRAGITPTGKSWEDFLGFCWREAKEGRTITKFLDWWLSDEWRRNHPSYKPDEWRVKWLMAFNQPNHSYLEGL